MESTSVNFEQGTCALIRIQHIQMRQGKDQKSIATWAEFRLTAERFERQRVASESGMAFLFTEGALVDAIRTGKW